MLSPDEAALESGNGTSAAAGTPAVSLDEPARESDTMKVAWSISLRTLSFEEPPCERGGGSRGGAGSPTSDALLGMVRRGVLCSPAKPGMAVGCWYGGRGAGLCVICSRAAGLRLGGLLVGAPSVKAEAEGAMPKTPVTPGMLGTSGMPAWLRGAAAGAATPETPVTPGMLGTLMPGMGPGIAGRPRIALEAAADDGTATQSCARPPGSWRGLALSFLIATELEERCRKAPRRPLTSCPALSSFRRGTLVDEVVPTSAAVLKPAAGWME